MECSHDAYFFLPSILLKHEQNDLDIIMSKKLFVGGLSWGTTEDGLKKICSEHGTVLSVVIVLDKETRKSRGFGFVEFSSELEAQTAMEKLDGAKLDGRAINLRPAVDNKNKRGRDNRGDSRSRDNRGDSRGRDNRGDSRGRDNRGDARSRDNRGDSRHRDFSRSSPPRSENNTNSRNYSPEQNTPRKNYRDRQPRTESGPAAPSQDWGAEDKWGKDRRRRREGKKKKKQYKKNNSWDDWDDG